MVRKKAPVGSLAKRQLQKTFIREWREFRNLTQGDVCSRIEELTGASFSESKLSRIENQESPYSQVDVEILAQVLRCTVADLLIRNPLDRDAPWSLLESLKPETRKQAIDMLKTFKRADDAAEAPRTGTGG